MRESKCTAIGATKLNNFRAQATDYMAAMKKYCEKYLDFTRTLSPYLCPSHYIPLIACRCNPNEYDENLQLSIENSENCSFY
jgi:hypothetical protein